MEFINNRHFLWQKLLSNNVTSWVKQMHKTPTFLITVIFQLTNHKFQVIICFNLAPFEGFKSEIFRLIKEVWAASVVWRSPGCWFVSSWFLSPGVYPHHFISFPSFFSLSITSLLLRCQSLSTGCCPSPSLCLLTQRPHQADPSSCLSAQETSQGGSAITTSSHIFIFLGIRLLWGLQGVVSRG